MPGAQGCKTGAFQGACYDIGPPAPSSFVCIMAASGPENIISSPSGDRSPGRRAHTYSRLTTAIAVLALAAAIYALIRTDSIRDKLDVANQTVVAANADKELLRAELK